jgi:hypothetical protein
VTPVRHWLTPRCLLIVLLLVVAPGAALTHLLITWLPGKVALARLNGAVKDHTGRLDAVCVQTRVLLEQTDQLERSRAALDDPARRAWLPQRDRDGAFDQLAEAFRAADVSLEQMTLAEPALYAAVSRRNLLACERVTIDCTGDYVALAACLDRLVQLDLPLRITRLGWNHSPPQLRLTLQIEVPFVPDDALRTALADAAKLEDKDES